MGGIENAVGKLQKDEVPDLGLGPKFPDDMVLASRVRRDIWALEQSQPWHPITRAYAEAIRVMKTRPASDPTSWTYQAEIHGSSTHEDQWRNMCQHGSWFFLPWHRMYLYWFEQIVRATIKTLPGVSDKIKSSWALPYWNYARGGTTNTLPQAFRDLQTPDGKPNPLRVSQRNSAINAGGALPASATDSTSCLKKLSFTGGSSGGPTTGGFGGPVTGLHHNPGTSGAVESVPHNIVHGLVGGFMGGFDTAPLDPIFWLHHCNIDRLWEVWDRQPNRVNPSTANWTTDQVFHFHNAKGADVTQTCSKVVNTQSLGYVYEQFQPVLSPSAFSSEEAKEAQPAAGLAAEEPPSDRPAEMVGATDSPLQLTGERTGTQVPLSSPAAFRDEPVDPERVYLNVEEITGEKNPETGYKVLVNIPDGDDASDDTHEVGVISFFGIEQTSKPDSEHSSMRYVFDITDLYQDLKSKGTWDESAVKVTFEPIRVEPPADASFTEPSDLQPDPPVSIGRVSVFFQ